MPTAHAIEERSILALGVSKDGTVFGKKQPIVSAREGNKGDDASSMPLGRESQEKMKL